MNDAKTHYASEVERLSQLIKAKQITNRWIVLLRPFLFFPALILLLAAYTRTDVPASIFWLGWSLAALFACILVWHESVRFDLESNKTRRLIYKKMLARLDRTWNEIPYFIHPASKLEDYNSTSAEDLDLFGTRSLFHWVCLASTSIGQRRLAQWLAQWSDSDSMVARQKGVLDLRDQRRKREEILFITSQLSNAHASPEGFTEWSKGPSWLKQHRISHILSWIGPIIIAAGLIWTVIAKASEAPSLQWIGLVLIGVGVAGNVLLMLGKVGSIHDIFQKINSGHREVDGYRDLYLAMGQLEGESAMVRTIRETSAQGPCCANRGFHRMRQFVWLANLQRNSLLYIPHLLLQILFQWDFRIMELLEGWKREYGSHVQSWLDALADCEALISAATIADEYRDWTFPIWISNGIPLAATALGHPLLPDTKRVKNSITIERDRPLLLVTGSNMAGKSTLLRSLGLNILLSRIGSPVCAESFRAEPFDLATSMRIQDSLQDGVSFFMAELYRLRAIVEQAREEANKKSGGRPLLTLLDEILQGTNSRERQIAVLHVVHQLIESKVITAISTHDLELADREEIQKMAQVVHFREYFEMVDGKEIMRFDFLMRPGPTPTTNALKLLELVGLRQKEK